MKLIQISDICCCSYSKAQQTDEWQFRWWSLSCYRITMLIPTIANEWDALFGDEVLESKFKMDTMFTVVAGGTGRCISTNNLCC